MNLMVRVIPRARQNKVTVREDGSLKVHTTTAPTDGKANESVIKILAAHFGVPKSRIKLIRGSAVNNKVFSIDSSSLSFSDISNL